jgi:hypothetical protein
MELMEGGKTYGKHKLKVRAYIKAKKLIRKAKKTFPTKRYVINLQYATVAKLHCYKNLPDFVIYDCGAIGTC